MALPRFLALLLALALALGVAGCGSGSSGEETTASRGAEGGSRQFESKGGDNSIQRFGGDTTGSEREEAAAALHEYLDARAAGAWAEACAQLAKAVTAQLGRYPGGGKSQEAGCEEALAGVFEAVPESALRQGAIAEVGSFRVAGKRGFLLFHGADGDYFVPMYREGGHWRVAAVAPSALP